MRIVSLLLLLLFGAGALGLSWYAERQTKEARKYGTDELIRSIRKHNEEHKHGSASFQQETPRNTNRQVIQYGGGVAIVPQGGGSSTSAGKTYYGYDESIPPTNEGQPGQPLPLTRQPPPVPVYR